MREFCLWMMGVWALLFAFASGIAVGDAWRDGDGYVVACTTSDTFDETPALTELPPGTDLDALPHHE